VSISLFRHPLIFSLKEWINHPKSHQMGEKT
jgi:hypothetical protein